MSERENLSPERLEAIEKNRDRIMDIIAGRAIAASSEIPQAYIGYEEGEVIS